MHKPNSTVSGQMTRPVLFSGPMIRAILEGRKTQTRRIVKHDGIEHDPDYWNCRGIRNSAVHGCPAAWFQCKTASGSIEVIPCPYGVAGDRLWVRETWADRGDKNILYASDFRTDATTRREMSEYIRWRPSIHMPRWASRITLEITKVRVERLQDISEEDAKAEAIENYQAVRGIYSRHNDRLYARAYARLWDLLHGKGAWEKNPWVWVLEFRMLE